MQVITKMNAVRYTRQTIIQEVGQQGQQRIKNARILCIGVGGLGSPASLYLAAAGVGTIGLIDGDRVDSSNLQRQILFKNNEEGLQKVEAAQRRLQELNPEVEIQSINAMFTAENAASILPNFDLVIDGCDNFSTKFLANDATYKRGIPLVYGAVDRFEGQVSLLNGTNSPCYRCLHPTPPKAQIRNCAESGVLGSVVGTIGTLQATLALQYVISGGDPTHPLCPKFGELTLFDFRGKWNIRTLQIPKNPKCPTCSRPPEQVELIFSSELCVSVRTISPDSLRELLAKDPSSVLLVDVREDEEWAEGHIPGATHWPLDRLEAGSFPLRSGDSRTLAIYCKSGKRSQRAAQILVGAGFSQTLSLAGGIDGWKNHKLAP